MSLKRRDKSNRLLSLFLYSDCFNDGEATHLGFKYKGVYYCITHSKFNGYEIPKKYLKMRDISSKPEYLKVCETTPKIVHETKMKVSEEFIIKYLNKNKNDNIDNE